MILLFYHLEILPEILSIFFVSCVAFAIFLWQFCHLMNYMSKPMCQIKVWWKYCINLLKTIWQSFKFRKHCWHLWLKNIAEECWTFFSSWQFFWQKNITLSLCHQIAELKLPMCGQGLKLMPDLTKKTFLPNILQKSEDKISTFRLRKDRNPRFSRTHLRHLSTSGLDEHKINLCTPYSSRQLRI